MTEPVETGPPSIESAAAANLRILVVDDDEGMRETLRLCFDATDHRVTAVDTPDLALVMAERAYFDVAFVDVFLDTESGLDLIPKLLERCPWIKVVMITGHASIESAVEAMRRGAYEYLIKPFTPQDVRLVAQRVEELRLLQRHVEALEQEGGSRLEPLLESGNAAMSRAVETARQVAHSHATVLLLGESGTGKGVLARRIHQWSQRASGPFAVVSSPSLTAELLSSELFGHVRGAFTGAVASTTGKVAVAEGGTLFLDEVGDIPITIQPKLLRFLQDREYERVGDPETREADVRVITATNVDLESAVERGDFREDLFYRLNVIQITVPPLRQRPEDIVPLARSFLSHFGERYKKSVSGFTDKAEQVLMDHRWPGNVRELQNAVERAVILARTQQVGANLLPDNTGGGVVAGLRGENVEDLPSLEGMEERYIAHVLEVTESIEEAAEVLGVAPSTLWRRRRKYGL